MHATHHALISTINAARVILSLTASTTIKAPPLRLAQGLGTEIRFWTWMISVVNPIKLIDNPLSWNLPGLILQDFAKSE